MSADHVVAGNGIDELLLMSALALVDSAAGAVVSANTYPGHANAVRATRHAPVTVPLRGLRVDVDLVIDSMSPGRVVFVCNPHNPTGTALTREEVDALALAANERRSVLVVDEAYIEYSTPDETSSAVKHVHAGLPVIVLRTFSKIYGLAGLRCGYALAPPRLCDELRRLKNVLVFNVNRLALVAAEASLRDGAFVDDVRVRTRDALADLHTWLRAQPWTRTTTSVTNFVLVELPWPARRVSSELALRRVMVRDCTDLGLPNQVRISAGIDSEMDLARAALAEAADRLGSAGPTDDGAGARP